MENLIEIGIITKAQGLKGEVRIKLFNFSNSIFNDINYIVVENIKYKITKFTDRLGFVILKLENVDNIDLTKNLIGKKAFIFKDDVVNYDENISSGLIGYKIISNELSEIGTVTDVKNYGASDVFYVKTNINKEIIFANAPDVIEKIDDVKKCIIVNKENFEEVSIYN